MAEQNPTKTGQSFKTGNLKKRGEELSDFVFGKVPPQAIPLEEAVLGAIMLEKDALTVVLDILRPPSFYTDAHQLIYKAMMRLFEKSHPIDMLTVTEELKKSGDLKAAGGAYYLVELTNKVASAANIEYHARIIAQKFIQRELIQVSSKIIKSSFEDTTDVFQLLDDAEQGLFAIAQQNMSRTIDSMSSLASKIIKQLEELKDREDGLTGVPTGFTDLDRLTSGWQPSDLIILAARPGMGKTSFVLSLAKNSALDFKKPVAIFSLEMSSIQLAQRIVSMDAEISGHKMRNGQLEDYEWQQLHSSIEKVSEASIFIDDTPGINVFELRAKCRRLKMQHDIQLVIIDYLQLMSGGSDNQRGNREQEVSAISRALKGLAKELNVPVIALSQLSRAVEIRGGSKRPQLSDLRESGCLTGDTLIQDALTGKRYTIKELAEREKQEPIYVLGVDNIYQIRPRKMVKAFYSGDKKVFELVTRSGKRIKASSNHPFLKLDGWKVLEDLSVGDKIATPREIKISEPTNILSNDELILLAHLIGDGCILPKQPYHYTSADKHNIAVVKKTAKELNISYSGSIKKNGISVQRLKKYNEILQSKKIQNCIDSDIHWDEIVNIIPLGVEPVYDATVDEVHNFVANDIIVHNSIEQDADQVAFIYRPEYYDILEDEEGMSLKGVAEVIMAKNRHGKLDTIRMKFTAEFARFSDLEDRAFDDLPDDTFTNTTITMPSKINEDEDIPF
jgi:replicative DNA helicase